MWRCELHGACPPPFDRGVPGRSTAEFAERAERAHHGASAASSCRAGSATGAGSGLGPRGRPRPVRRRSASATRRRLTAKAAGRQSNPAHLAAAIAIMTVQPPARSTCAASLWRPACCWRCRPARCGGAGRRPRAACRGVWRRCGADRTRAGGPGPCGAQRGCGPLLRARRARRAATRFRHRYHVAWRFCRRSRRPAWRFPPKAPPCHVVWGIWPAVLVRASGRDGGCAAVRVRSGRRRRVGTGGGREW